MITFLLAVALTCDAPPSTMSATLPDAGPDVTVIGLGIGSQTVLSVDHPGEMWRSNPAVADVKAMDHGVLVVGSEEGETELQVRRRRQPTLRYLFHVRLTTPCEVISPLRQLLGDREGITIRQVGDHTYFDGQAYTQDDWDRLQELLKLFPDVKSFVKLSPAAVRKAVVEANAELAHAGLPYLRAELYGHTVVIEGTALDPGDDAKAEVIVGPVRKLASEM